jgi:hypothetical protein
MRRAIGLMILSGYSDSSNKAPMPARVARPSTGPCQVTMTQRRRTRRFQSPPTIMGPSRPEAAPTGPRASSWERPLVAIPGHGARPIAAGSRSYRTSRLIVGATSGRDPRPRGQTDRGWKPLLPDFAPHRRSDLWSRSPATGPDRSRLEAAPTGPRASSSPATGPGATSGRDPRPRGQTDRGWKPFLPDLAPHRRSDLWSRSPATGPDRSRLEAVPTGPRASS